MHQLQRQIQRNSKIELSQCNELQYLIKMNYYRRQEQILKNKIAQKIEQIDRMAEKGAKTRVQTTHNSKYQIDYLEQRIKNAKVDTGKYDDYLKKLKHRHAQLQNKTRLLNHRLLKYKKQYIEQQIKKTSMFFKQKYEKLIINNYLLRKQLKCTQRQSQQLFINAFKNNSKDIQRSKKILQFNIKNKQEMKYRKSQSCYYYRKVFGKKMPDSVKNLNEKNYSGNKNLSNSQCLNNKPVNLIQNSSKLSTRYSQKSWSAKSRSIANSYSFVFKQNS